MPGATATTSRAWHSSRLMPMGQYRHDPRFFKKKAAMLHKKELIATVIQ
jgi:hypothetical protein